MRIRHFFVLALYVLGVSTTMAQQIQMPSIPVDTAVRIGHLDNGLTYYIRHNEYPKNVASYYIAQKVGSINEDDNQRGLAHLLEHLAFNGTDHFKDNQLQEYLQSIGVEYGRNLNAETGVEGTTYYFTDVPTTRISAVDSCMLILKDWSNGITLTQKAIDDERDVVHGEYRMRMVGTMRMIERQLPALYPDCKYGYRLPIGLMSVIDSCNPKAIRDYYHKWYRPDNQAIIVVGDIDVDHIESKIKELFGGIQVPANATKVIPVKVPDNNKAIYLVDKDKEQQMDIITTMMKHEAMPDSMKTTISYLVQEYIKSTISNMLNARFSEKAKEPDCPFLQASAVDEQYLISKTKDAFTLETAAKPGKILEAYEAALKELKRVREYGFTATEYERAKADFMSAEETYYTNRNKMKNEQFTGQYIRNFTDNEPIPSAEDEYHLYQMFIPQINVEMVNQAARELISDNDTNFVNIALLEEKEGKVYPTAQQLADVVARVRTSKVTAYVDNVKQEPLMATLPKAGKIEKTTENKKFGYKELSLSNGAKVILKKTDFKDNEILFFAVADGGLLDYAARNLDDGIYNASIGCMTWGASGLGNFSNMELQKALAGKMASCGLYLSTNARGASGSSTPKDIETLFQLIYQNFTAVSKDEKSVKNQIDTYMAYLANQSNNPSIVYQDSVISTIYMNNPLFRVTKAEDLKKVNYDRALAIQKELFANAKDFNFYFVGNFNEDSIKPLIEQYIASLPDNAKSFEKKDVALFKGEVRNEFTKAMENSQTQAREQWRSEKMPFTLKNDVLLDIASRLYDMLNDRTIREKLSAAYSAGASQGTQMNPDGTQYYMLLGSALLNPDKSKEAISYFDKNLKELIAKPNAEDLQKVKAILLTQADVDAKNNNYWFNVIDIYKRYGVDRYTDYKKTVKEITADEISAFLKEIVRSGNHVSIIMNAVKK